MHFLLLYVLFIPIYSWRNRSATTDKNKTMMDETFIVDQINITDNSNDTQETVTMNTTFSTTLPQQTVAIDTTDSTPSLQETVAMDTTYSTALPQGTVAMDTTYSTTLPAVYVVDSTVYQDTTQIQTLLLQECEEVQITCDHGCSCSILCIVFGDCCYSIYTDVLEIENEEQIVDVTLNSFVALQEYASFDKNQLLPVDRLKQYGECITMKTSDSSYQIINTCPQGFENTFVVTKCRKMSDDNIWNIPVFTNVSNAVQVTFRNIFCAYCHGYTVDEVVFWDASVHCDLSNDTNIQRYVKTNQCYIQAKPPSDVTQPYRCFSDFGRYKSCPPGKLNSKSDISHILCSAYINPVYVNYEGYTNENCLQCFEFKDFHYTCPLESTTGTFTDRTLPGLDIFFAYDKNVMSSSNNIDFQVDCQKHERFDFLTMSCKAICSVGSQHHDSSCIRGVTSSTLYMNCSKVISYSKDEFTIVNDVLLIDGQPLYEDSTYSIINNTLFLCFDPTKILNCSSFITYANDEYVSINDTLFINGEIRELHRKEYFEKNDTLYVCTVDAGPLSFGSIKTITNVCIAVSVMSLLAVITFHIKYAKLQNLHGKNIICLSSSLLLAQCVLLICGLVYLPINVVTILSIIEHFSWLSVFGWNAIISFDIARRLIIMSGSVNQSKKSLRFKIYLGLAYGVPAIGVSICSILDYTMSVKVLGYGQDGNCWISEPNGLLYAFIIPVVTVLVFSVSCFFMIFYKVESTRRAATIATSNRKERVTCIIYVKLFIMIGLSWIIGIISSNVESIVLSYINGILNGLQGFFLALVCLCNCRVIRMIRNKRAKKESTSSVSTKNNTSL